VSLLVFAAVAVVIQHELAGIHLRDVLLHFRATPPAAIFAAGLCTIASYWLLGFYDVLGLRYVGRQVPASTTFFTAFIASAFGHNLGVAAFTGAAVRYRIYGTQGLNAADVATLAGFCSVTGSIGLAAIAGVSLISAPGLAGALLHLHDHVVTGLGIALLGGVAAYAAWAFTARRLSRYAAGTASAAAIDSAAADPAGRRGSRPGGSSPVAVAAGLRDIGYIDFAGSMPSRWLPASRATCPAASACSSR